MGDDKNRHFHPCQIREPSTLPRDIVLCPDVPIFLWIKQSWWMNPTKRCILMYFSSIEIHMCLSAILKIKACIIIESVGCQNIFHRDYIVISPRHTTEDQCQFNDKEKVQLGRLISTWHEESRYQEDCESLYVSGAK